VGISGWDAVPGTPIADSAVNMPVAAPWRLSRREGPIVSASWRSQWTVPPTWPLFEGFIPAFLTTELDLS
jgi:hypothetical protein